MDRVPDIDIGIDRGTGELADMRVMRRPFVVVPVLGPAVDGYSSPELEILEQAKVELFVVLAVSRLG
jgi:hypothetical protein